MNKVWRILACVVFGALFIVLFTGITMFLWNWLVPTLFSGPVINFWQALGLLALTKILFHGFGGKGHCPGNHAGHHWKGKIYEKFANMSPEERESFKNKMKEKWCRFDSRHSDENSSSINK